MKKTFCLIATILLTSIAFAQYNVGDYYEKDNVKGIVIKVDNSGEHGLIVSLDKFEGKWSSDKKAKFETNAFFEDDGQKNMDAVAAYLKESGNTWSLFPYYEWCRNKGEGWYAPALEEMKALAVAINGSMGTYMASNFSKFDATLKSHNGESLFGKNTLPKGGSMPYTMLSSTESNGGKIYAFGVFASSPFADPEIMIGEAKKTFSIYLGSRAIHKF